MLKQLLVIVVVAVDLLLLPGRVSTSSVGGGTSGVGVRKEKEAYVTLLYGSPLVSVRVLGLSLKLTGTCNDMVVLCVDPLSSEDKRILEGDGWIVKMVEHPSLYRHDSGPHRLDKVLAAMSVMWTLTEYRRVVYLDSDSVVYANIEELFRCGRFCAALTFRPNLVGSSLFVVKPDFQEYFDLMMNDFSKRESLLSHFYNSLSGAPVFNASDLRDHTEPIMQLPVAVYNVDSTWYYLYSGGSQQFKVIHHSVELLKPWKWWAYTLFDLNWHWVDLRDSLPEENPLRWSGLFTAASVCFVLFVIASCFTYVELAKPVWLVVLKRSSIVFDVVISLLFPLSCFLAFWCVPESMHPHFAVSAFCIWTTVFFHVSCVCVHNLTDTSRDLEYPDLTGALPVIILLFSSFLFPMYVPSFMPRMCLFLISISVCFISSHFVVKKCLAVSNS